MIKYIAIAVSSLMLSGIASAHFGHYAHNKSLVNIQNAHKVFITKGISHHEKVKMMSCLLMLKKHKNMEEAIDAKMAKIKAKCEKYNIDDKKCEIMKHKVAKKIYACFTMKKFLLEFFNKSEMNAE